MIMTRNNSRKVIGALPSNKASPCYVEILPVAVLRLIEPAPVNSMRLHMSKTNMQLQFKPGCGIVATSTSTA